MISKIALLVVSIMVVVGVIIAVSVMVNAGDHPSLQAGPNSSMWSMKTVTSICELTKYKGPCATSLEPAAKNPAASSNDYILAALEATLNELNRSSDATSKVTVDKAQEFTYGAVQDCRRFMDLAAGRVRTSIDIVRDSDLNSLDHDQVHELLSWMTGVHALHTSCLDQIEDPLPKSAVRIAIHKSTELSHNSVNIFAELPRILKLFNENGVKKLAISLRHPRTLASGSGGYPTWFKVADRKLLADQQQTQITPNVVVAQDGSGQFKTIREAITAYPGNDADRFIIYVKAGDYKEQVIIDKGKPNIFMYGDGIGKTIVTGNKNYGMMKVGTMHTAAFANEATGFIARGMTFRNKAGPQGQQAVAFRSMGDKTALFDCNIEGYQGTLFYQLYRQLYRNCLIYGSMDFIFGKGQAVVQDSEIIVRKPMEKQTNTVTADGKEIPKGSNGLVLHNCRIVPEKALFPTRFEIPTYLGRPSTPEALTVVMQSELGDFIRPEGWKEWGDRPNHKTCQMFEYANRGPGAGTDMRNEDFEKFKVLSADEAAEYTPAKFLAGSRWLPQTGVPFRLALQ